MTERRRFTVAAVQAAPVLPLDKQATIAKVCELVAEAGRHGAELVVFPETFVPMYPNWSLDLSQPTAWPRHLAELTRQAVEVPGSDLEPVVRAAERAGAYVALGVNERVALYDGMLYNTLVLIGREGRIVGKHRKLLPSNREKAFWHRGDGVDLRAVWPTDLGRVGGLICYEHLQPLLKYALFAQGEQVHCAVWPGWPDYPKPGRTNRHVVEAASRAYALEGQCFVVVASLYVPPALGERAGFTNASWTFFGGSGIVNPAGEYLAGPVYDEETILYAEVDLDQIVVRKAAVDTTGRDTRWDILRLEVEDEAFYAPFARGGAPAERERAEAATLARLGDLDARLRALEAGR